MKKFFVKDSQSSVRNKLQTYIQNFESLLVPIEKVIESQSLSIVNLNLSLIVAILLLLDPKDFYKIGRVSTLFYGITRNIKICHLRDPEALRFDIPSKTSVEEVKSIEDIKNLLRSGNNRLFFETLKRYPFSLFGLGYEIEDNLVKLFIESISHRNYEIFKFCLDRITMDIIIEFHGFLAIFGKYGMHKNLSIILTYFDVNIPFHCIKNQATEQDKDHVYNSLVNAGARYIFAVINLLQYCEKNLRAMQEKIQLRDKITINSKVAIKSNFISYIFKLKGKQGVKEFLDSPYASFFISNEMENIQKAGLKEEEVKPTIESIQKQILCLEKQVQILMEEKEVLKKENLAFRQNLPQFPLDDSNTLMISQNQLNTTLNKSSTNPCHEEVQEDSKLFLQRLGMSVKYLEISDPKKFKSIDIEQKIIELSEYAKKWAIENTCLLDDSEIRGYKNDINVAEWTQQLCEEPQPNKGSEKSDEEIKITEPMVEIKILEKNNLPVMDKHFSRFNQSEQKVDDKEPQEKKIRIAMTSI